MHMILDTILPDYDKMGLSDLKNEMSELMTVIGRAKGIRKSTDDDSVAAQQ